MGLKVKLVTPRPGGVAPRIGDVGRSAHDQRRPVRLVDARLREGNEPGVLALLGLRMAVVVQHAFERERRAQAAAIERVQRPRVQVGQEVHGHEGGGRGGADHEHGGVGPRAVGVGERQRRREHDDRHQEQRAGHRAGEVRERDARARPQAHEEPAEARDGLKHGRGLRRASPELEQDRDEDGPEAAGPHRGQARSRRGLGCLGAALVAVVEQRGREGRDGDQHDGERRGAQHQTDGPGLQPAAHPVARRPEEQQQEPVDEDGQRKCPEDPPEEVGHVGCEVAADAGAAAARGDRIGEGAVERAIDRPPSATPMATSARPRNIRLKTSPSRTR